MSPWGRFILEHIGLNEQGTFYLHGVLQSARHLYPHVDITYWWKQLAEDSF